MTTTAKPEPQVTDENEKDFLAPTFRTEPILQRVEWLIGLIDLKNRQQAYEIINSGLIRPGCAVRIGRKVRLRIAETLKWIEDGCPDYRPGMGITPKDPAEAEGET